MRTEHDSLGAVELADDVLWGAQTQRSLHNFKIGRDQFSVEFIHAFALVKKAAAQANQRLGKLPAKQAELIAAVCDEIASGRHDNQFPLLSPIAAMNWRGTCVGRISHCIPTTTSICRSLPTMYSPPPCMW